MIYGIISDVHSNFDALEVVLSNLEETGVERLVFLGDIVGYNAEPDRCIEVLLPRLYKKVRGNHDKAVTGLMNLDYFNDVARKADIWTMNVMKSDNIEMLRKFKKGPEIVDSNFMICHGSPMDEDKYILTYQDVEETLLFMSNGFPDIDICFFGHTHVPFVFEEGKGILDVKRPIHLKSKKRYIINPGSVGQPRDGNPLSSYGILDSENLIFKLYRVAYPIEKTQAKIRKAGLPDMLAERLAMGY